MESEFPLVKLVEVLKHRKDFITIDDFTLYKRCTAKLHAKGIVLRDEIEGSRLKTKKQQLCKAGDFLVAEIDAKVGGFGIVPPELEDAIVSSHYFLFEVNEEKMERGYLNFFIKTQNFKRQIQARGSTNYAAIRPKHVLDLEIPLLSLLEQKSMVARIESLTARIEEARRLRGEAVKEAEKLFELFLRRIFLNNNQYDLVKLGDKNYFELNPSKSELSGLDDDIDVSFVPMTCVDPELGKIKNFDIRKLFEVRKGYTYFKEGDVLFAKITPCMENGNVAIAQNIINGIGFGTTEFHVVRVLEKVLPKWVYYLFRTKGFRDIAKGSMTGTAGQRRVPKSFLEQYEIPLPLLHEQRRIIAYLDSLQAKADELKRLQAETEKELEELVPSILDKAFKGEL